MAGKRLVYSGGLSLMTQAIPIIRFKQAKASFEAHAQLKRISLARYHARVWTWGNGPDLFLIHGLADHSDSFLFIASELSKHFRCIGYDLPGGHLDDGANLWRYQHEDLATDALHILDALGSKEAFLLAGSFGTTIAQRLLHEQPKRFPAAILQGGFAQRPLGWQKYLMAYGGRFWKNQPVGQFRFYAKTLHALHGIGFASRETEAWDWFLHCVGTTPLRTMAHQAIMIAHLDLLPLLPKIAQPVLLLCGEKDQVIDAKASSPLVLGLQKATHIVVPDWGHVPAYTHPEEMVDRVLGFLHPNGLS